MSSQNSIDEITQEAYLEALQASKSSGRTVLLVDTILKSIEGANTVVYNPVELAKLPTGALLVFYCDTGKVTKERIGEYRKKLPMHECVSLRGGRGYWRPYLRIDTTPKEQAHEYRPYADEAPRCAL